ncbi:unnamed protein product [Amoebophrya sp. A25]|nr:unnamed protein product [Amoebophrya sp. A25]|eukprot:GSA25T00003662001.1
MPASTGCGAFVKKRIVLMSISVHPRSSSRRCRLARCRGRFRALTTKASL